jgi:uncharacterized protein DUF3859
MRKIAMRIVPSLLLLMLASMGAYAQTSQIDRIDVTEYGLYTATTQEDKPAGQGLAHNAVSDERLAATTRTVPMQLGVHFGFRYTVVGAPAGSVVPLKFVTLFPSPGLRNPQASQAILRDEYSADPKIGDTSFHGYSLDDPWELVPGTWIMEIWYGNRKLVSQRFMVGKP